MNFDLHIHSKYSSDGEWDLPNIIAQCIDRAISCFSITDHNSVRGNAEAFKLAAKKEIDFIPGIEIDCIYEGIDIHVLGYAVNCTSRDFEQLEKEVATKILSSFDAMIDNLCKLGFRIDADVVLEAAGGKEPSGELIAEVMLSNEKYHTPLLVPYMPGGKRGDMPYINFYLDYFAQGKPAHVPIDYMDFTKAIGMIRDNGGIPVVAHPGLNLKGRETIAEQLLNKGADGLECFNNYHSMEQVDYFATIVQEKNKIMTCGSDFHGKTKPLISIGQFKSNDRFDDYLRTSVQRLKMQN